MIVHDCQQGTDQWFRLRAGIPTASQYSRIVSPTELRASKSQTGYIAELLAESEAGTVDFFEPKERWWALAREMGFSNWMDRGLALEEEARSLYAMMRDVDVQQPGFITTDDGKTGCSPDGWIPEGDPDGPGGLEMKARKPSKHIQILFEDDDIATATQVQGSMLITGAEWWDTFAFCPGYGPVLVREYRNEEIIGLLRVELGKFLERLETMRERLRSLKSDGLVLARGPFREQDNEEMEELVKARVSEGLIGADAVLKMLMARGDTPNTARKYLAWLRHPGTVDLAKEMA